MTTLLVAAAVVERDEAFLITRRPEGVHLEGLWEFPGGKCEPGETIEACLRRELHEELGVEASPADEILATTHDYEDRHVELHFVRCRLLGEPMPRLGQEMRWVRRDELAGFSFPPADSELIRLLSEAGTVSKAAATRRRER